MSAHESFPVRVAIGIITNQDKILVGKRSLEKPYSGYWEFPGGKIEKHETSRNALERELQEELNIQVINAHLCFECSHTYPDKIVALDVWQVTAYLGEPKAVVHQDLAWMTLVEITSLRILEGNLPIVEKIASILAPS